MGNTKCETCGSYSIVDSGDIMECYDCNAFVGIYTCNACGNVLEHLPDGDLKICDCGSTDGFTLMRKEKSIECPSVNIVYGDLYS